MKNKKLISISAALIISFLYSYVFYKNYILALVISIVLSFKFHKVFLNFLDKKDEIKFKIQFREFLDMLNSSVLSGNNLLQGIRDTSKDIKKYMSNNDNFSKYVEEIVVDIENGREIASAFEKFKEKVKCKEVDVFVDTLAISIEKGIDLNRVIGNSKEEINTKISTELEIDILIQNSKREFIIMIILPIIVLLTLNSTLDTSLTFSDYLIRSFGFLIILFSFYLGHKIVNLEI